MANVKKIFKRKIQLLLGKYLDKPEIPVNKTKGFSLVESEISEVLYSTKSKINYPCKLTKLTLGDYSYVATNAYIHNTIIGKFCSIGPNFCCGLGIHPTNGISTSPMFYSTAKQNGISLCAESKIEESKNTTIGNDVFVGANVTILDGVCIGNGAVVVNDIPAYAIAVGVPAKVIKFRFDNDVIEKLEEMKWWNWEMDKLRVIEMNFWNIKDFIK